jgi:hypothetical protein
LILTLGSSNFLIPKSFLELWLTLLTALQILKLCLLLQYSVLLFESLLKDEFCASIAELTLLGNVKGTSELSELIEHCS